MEKQRENLSFISLFPQLVNLKFYNTSGAFYKNVSDTDEGILTTQSLSHGKYMLNKISVDDFKAHKGESFLQKLRIYIDEQNEYSLNYYFNTMKIDAVRKTVISFVEDNINLESAFYEMVIPDNNAEKIGGFGTGVWDYFKSFIGVDAANNCLYRIEMGRD